MKSLTSCMNDERAKYSSALKPLLSAQREAMTRLKHAETAVREAKDRLEADLKSGRDTATARRVLHEAKQLCDAAMKTATDANEAIQTAADKEIMSQAGKLAQQTRNALISYLEQFALPE